VGNTTSRSKMIFDVEGLANVKRAADILDAMNRKQLALLRTQGKAAAANKRVASSITEQVSAHKRLQTTLTTTAAGSSRLTAKFKSTGLAGVAAANKIGVSWGSLGRIITGFAMYRGLTMITQGFRNAITEAVKYEVSIGEIMSISHNAPLSFNRWAQGVRELSEAWRESSADVAEGVYQALSNQIAEGAEALGFMNEAMKLSTITVSSTTESVQLLTGVLNSYHMSADNAGYISNIFFKTVELGRLRLKDMANTMGRVNMVGAQLGVQFEETAAAVATLSRQGVQPAETLTLLRNVMLKLIRPTDHMKEVFQSWGVESGEAAIAAFGLAGVLGKIEEAAKKGGDELAELGAMFGRIRAITGASGLVSNLDLFNQTLDELTKGARDANQALEEITQTAGYKLQTEWNKVKNIFTHDIGQELIQSLANINESIGSVSDRLKDLGKGLRVATVVMTSFFAGKVVAKVVLMTASFVEFAKVGLGFQLIVEGMKAKWAAFLVKFGPLPLLFAAVAAASYFMGMAYMDSVEVMTNAHLEMDEARVNSTRLASAEIARINREQMANTYRALTQGVENQKQTLLGLVADLQAAQNELTAVQKGQIGLEKTIFDLQMKNSSKIEKRRLLNKKMYHEYETISGLIREGETEAALKMVSDFEGTVSSIQSLMGGNRRYGPADQLRYRLQDAFQRELNASLAKHGDQTTPRAQAQLSMNQELIVSEREKIKVLDEYVKKLGDEEAAHKKMVTNLSTSLGEAQGLLQRMQVELGGLWGDAGMSRMFVAELDKEDTRNWIVKRWSGMTEDMQAEFDTSYDAYREFKEKIAGLAEMPIEDFHALPQETLEQDAAALESLYRTFSDKLTESQKGTFSAFMEWYKSNIGIAEASRGGLASADQAIMRHTRTIYLAEQSATMLAEKWEGIGNDWKSTATGIYAGIEAMQKATGNVSILYSNVMVESAGVLESARALNAETRMLNTEIRALQTENRRLSGGAFGGRFGAGGLASDFIPAMLRKGEYVTNPRATKNFLPDLVAMNNGARHAAGGNITNNVGDVNVTVQGGDTSERTARSIAYKLRRELRRGVSRIN